ncbi:MAG TPA: ATP-binding protein [Anaerolineae bacterium]
MISPAVTSGPSLNPELHPSPKWVIVGLVVLSTILIIVGDVRFETSERLRVLNFALLIYAASVTVWLLDYWRPWLGRLFTIVALVVFIGLGIRWLGVSEFLILLTIPTALAVTLLGFGAALAIALGETVLLWLLAQDATAGLSSAAVAMTLISIWSTLGVMGMTYWPLYDMARWSWRHFHQAQQLLEEARDRKTELERVLEALAQANRELALVNEKLAVTRRIAEEAQRAKAAFVAKVSHEFRTPLNMIIGLIDSLTETPEIYEQEIPPVLLKDLEIVYRNSNHLASMVNDVLDLSQAETGKLNLRPEWADLSVDIDNVLTVVRPLLEKKRLALQVSIPYDLPQVYYDCTRIRQVILNLVSNAARYTDAGGITLTVAQDGRYVVVSVSDTGPGISPADAERVFEPFYQSTSGAWRGQGGSGLGLSISQQLIELHDGQIWLESELAVGTTFSFKLPIAPASPREGGPDTLISEDWVWRERAIWPDLPELPYQQRVVLCDETGALEPLLSRTAPEVEFIEARNLAETIQALEECPAHAVIVNTASPQRLGPLIEAARLKVPDTPLIGCSLPPRIEYALEAGAVDYLTKPIRQANLKAVIEAIEGPLKRVLVVDDNPDIQQLFARMLSIYDASLEVITAASGAECLEELYARPPDLVLLDVIMPDLDGWQVLERKQQDEVIRDIPVVMVSGEDLLTQPFSSDVLLVSIGTGISVSQILRSSLELSKLLLSSE